MAKSLKVSGGKNGGEAEDNVVHLTSANLDNKDWDGLKAALERMIALKSDAAAVAQEVGVEANRLEKEGGISKFTQRTLLSLMKMGPEKAGPLVRELQQGISTLGLDAQGELFA